MGPASPRASPKNEATARRLALIRQSSTAPELAVRKALHRLGVRFRLDGRGLPGRPDVVNRSRKWAMFVHGCFWHNHQGCRRATVPKHNIEFWTAKFAANRDRDLRSARALTDRGYRVLTIWECETEKPIALRNLIVSFFSTLEANAISEKRS